VPGGTEVARHVTGHHKVVPRGGTKRGNNTAEGRGNKAAEDDNEGRNRRAWQQGRGRRRGRQRESEERAAGGRSGRSGSREVHNSERGTQLAAQGPSGNRQPFAKIYKRRYTENRTGATTPPREKMPKWRMKADGLLRPI
jgi:hypothetical protein